MCFDKTTFLYDKTRKTVRVGAASATFNVKTREFCIVCRFPHIFTYEKCVVSYSAEQEIQVGKFLLRESYVHVTTEADVAYESTSPKTGCMMLSLRLCYGAETCTYATYIFVNFEP